MIENCFCWKARPSESGPGALCQAPALRVGPRRSMCWAPALCVLGSGALCRAPALCVGPQGCIMLNAIRKKRSLQLFSPCISAYRLLGSATFVGKLGRLSPSPALCVGPRRSVPAPATLRRACPCLRVGPALCAAALCVGRRRSVSGPDALCTEPPTIWMPFSANSLACRTALFVSFRSAMVGHFCHTCDMFAEHAKSGLVCFAIQHRHPIAVRLSQKASEGAGSSFAAVHAS